MYYLKGDVITNGELFEKTYIEIIEGKITFVGKEKRNNNLPVKEIKAGFISAGFIDIHLHGVDGFDFMDSDEESFRNIAKILPKYGVTSFLATSRTSSFEDTMRFLESAKKHCFEEGAKMIGVHMEGPWINSQYSGAQNKAFIRQLTRQDLDKVIMPFDSIIKRITLAPEELEDSSIIKYLTSRGISVSAGHTGATLNQIGDAMKHGLKYITHTFNAMSPIHHRQPGTAAAALYFDELICEIISDGVHVHPTIIELLYRIKGMKGIILVSDCTGYNNLVNGQYKLRGKEIFREGNRITLKNGTLAGSAITIGQGLKYAIDHCNIPLEKAVYMATQAPVFTVNGNLGLGEVKEGYKADLVILDRDLNVIETIINGKTIYSK